MTYGNRHLTSQVSNRELSYGKFNFSQTAHNTRFFPTPIPPTATMSSLLIVASRVQAAVKAYCLAKEHANWAQWKGQFVDTLTRPWSQEHRARLQARRTITKSNKRYRGYSGGPEGWILSFGGTLRSTQSRARSSGARLEMVYAQVPTVVASLG